MTVGWIRVEVVGAKNAAELEAADKAVVTVGLGAADAGSGDVRLPDSAGNTRGEEEAEGSSELELAVANIALVLVASVASVSDRVRDDRPECCDTEASNRSS